MIFTEPDHSYYSPVYKFRWFFELLWKYKFMTVLNGVCILIKLCLKKKKTFWFTLVCLIISCICVCRKESLFIENFIYIPFMYFALEVIIDLDLKRMYVLYYMWVFLSVFGVFLGTNTGMTSTSAMMVNFASLALFLMGMEKGRYSVNMHIMNRVVLIAAVGCMFILRVFIVWTDWFRFEDFQYKIASGPLKGMYTNEHIFDEYGTILADMDTITRNGNSDSLLCVNYTPVAYLYADMDYATMGVAFLQYDYDRQERYYEMHPDKRPTVVYYAALSYTDEEKEFVERLYEDYIVEIKENRLIAVKNRNIAN